jgi:predicted enzyme related to lactoylglutathione lyase
MPRTIRSTATQSRAAAPLALGIAAGLLAGSAFAAPVQVPALSTPATAEAHLGKMVFVQLVTPDLAGAERFYGGLFGWTFAEVQAGGSQYAEASLNGRPVAGIVQRPLPAGEKRQPAWLGFLSAGDLDAVQKLALANGAKVLRAPHDVPNRGREAVFADPQGAVFAVLSSSSGDPADELAAPGEWIWSSLMTTDPDKDAAFYQTLFGYEVYDESAAGSGQHLILATENYARASANSMPTKRPGTPPHWLEFVRVDDAVAMTAKVVTLGGHVLVTPHTDRHGGQIAVVSDPQGAAFGLLEWRDTENKEMTK